MDVEEEVFGVLSADTAVTNLTGGRIFPNKIPDEATPPPWAYFGVTSEEPTEGLEASGATTGTLEVSIFARTLAETRAVHRAIKSALNKYRGGPIRRILWADYSTDEAEEGYLGTAEYTFWADEDPVIPLNGHNARILAGTNSIDFRPNGSASAFVLTPAGAVFEVPLIGSGAGLTDLPIPPAPDLSAYARKDLGNVFTPANTLILPIDILGISGMTQPLLRVRNDVGIVVLRCNNNSGSVEVNRINTTSGRWDFLNNGEMLLAAEAHLRFSNAGGSSGPWEVGIRRSASGVIDITNGTTSGALGRLRTQGYLVRSGAADPTASDLADGYTVVWRNTTSGDVKLWANIGGTLLSTGALS